MALAFVYRASIYSTTAATSYTASPAWTPAAGSLLIAFVVGSVASGPVDPDGATPMQGHGATWTKLTLSDNVLGTTHALSVWVTVTPGSPTSAAAQATWASNRSGCSIIEFEVTGAYIAGGASAAIAQNPANEGSGTSSSLASAMSQTYNDSRPIAWNVHLANEATSPKSSPAWTETAGADGNFNNPATGAEAEFIESQWDGSPTASWTTSSSWKIVALEVRALIASAQGQAAFLGTREAAAQGQAAWLAAYEALTSGQQAYLNAVLGMVQGQAVYLDALEFINGSKASFLLAHELVSAGQAGFLRASEPASNGQPGFLSGNESTAQGQAAYLNASDGGGPPAHGAPLIQQEHDRILR